jgi:hypothetical protein
MIGIRELFIVVAVALALYGRSGMLKSQRFQSIWPWLSPVRRTPAPSTSTRRGPVRSGPSNGARSDSDVEERRERGRVSRFVLEGNHLYWLLTILAATAVAAWVVTRTLIVSGSHGAR